VCRPRTASLSDPHQAHGRLLTSKATIIAASLEHCVCACACVCLISILLQVRKPGTGSGPGFSFRTDNMALCITQGLFSEARTHRCTCCTRSSCSLRCCCSIGLIPSMSSTPTSSSLASLHHSRVAALHIIGHALNIDSALDCRGSKIFPQVRTSQFFHSMRIV
jgi:hypothetical protein